MDLDRGLRSSEVEQKLKEHGPNVLPEKPPPSDFSILLEQFKSPLVYVLLLAGVVTLFLGDYTDAAIIFIAVVVNTALGFFQERKASRALHALNKLLTPTASVIRDGEVKKVDAKEVVPGDIVIVGQGDKIPADGKLVEANRIFVDEAILTGESVPVHKGEDGAVFMGTIVSAGRGVMLVESTGEETEVGKIAESVQEPSEETPLMEQMAKFSKHLLILTVALTGFVFVVGLITGREVGEMFITSVALAVSAIPEGLLVALTVVLAIGMQRILRHKGLVRNLVSAETLGGVTTICVDKTGTLTEGKMRVIEAVGDEDKLARQAVLANDLDDPIVIAAWEWGNERLKMKSSHFAGVSRDKGKVKAEDLRKKYPRLDSIPFSSKERFFASLHKWSGEGNMMFVNGAPDFLLGWSKLSKKDKDYLQRRINELTGKGDRVVGFASKRVPLSKKHIHPGDVKKGLEWVGILAFSDPVRKGVGEAFQKTAEAGVKSLVITGDYADTAISVMHKMGVEVNGDEVVLGEQLKHMSSKELCIKLADGKIKLFARTTPEQKLKIVEALKKNGEVVAMTGDGVNDAPALNRADIGIVVGSATDVAKESADLVLLDSNFATIVEAVEEGRGIFDNIRKVIIYLMSDAFCEIVAVVGAILFGLPLPITAAQILWINLVSDGFPDLALTVDPKDPDIMKRPPRPFGETLITPWMRMLVLIVSITGGVIGLVMFVISYIHTGDVAVARSVAFATLGVNSLVYVFSVRTLTEPFWKENLFDNKWLILAVGVGVMLQASPFLIPWFGNVMGVVPLSLAQWIGVLGASVFMFIMIEVSKVAFRHKLVR